MVANRKFSSATRALALAAWLGLAALPGPAAGEAPRALLTIADGPVELLRGAARHAAPEGLALAGDDIVRTGTATRVARIEFADGRVLDLGPDTQALLLTDAAASAHGLPGVAAVIAQGWAKLSAPPAAQAGAALPARLAAPDLLVSAPAAGSLLLQVGAEGRALVFAESRAATLSRRARPGGGTPPTDARLREGEAWLRHAGDSDGSVSTGASLPALREAPRTLADSLPRRAMRFAGSPLEAGAGEPLDASDLAPWLRAEPALIAALRPRLAALSRQALRPAAGAWAARKGVRSASTRRAPRPAVAARTPRLVPGLTAPAPASAGGPAIALEATTLLPTERVQPVLPAVGIAVVPAAPTAPASRPAPRTGRPTQAALAIPPRTVAP